MKRCQTEVYLTLSKIQIFKTLTSQFDLGYRDKKFHLFPVIPYKCSHFGKFLIVQSIRIPVSKTLLTGKVKDALNSLELTSGNYEIMFWRPQSCHSVKYWYLLTLHPVSSSSNIADLRKIYYKIESVSRNLQRF